MNNSWGFKKDDTDWKDAKTVYNQLQDINTKGGNLLLNIGPKGDGTIPEESVKILLEVGKMLKK
jgi:alpha-L-fucosidase